MIRFEIFIGKDSLWHWHLLAANNEIVCWSEGYSTRQTAINSVNWVKTYSPNAAIA
ncbi:DUF1508 domain-containing protein [Candidatus Collierbacteria bacterium]|nr:DUF1508 domain-containing protein [Candidatus Collierbacteria bacterium]